MQQLLCSHDVTRMLREASRVRIRRDRGGGWLTADVGAGWRMIRYDVIPPIPAAGMAGDIR